MNRAIEEDGTAADRVPLRRYAALLGHYLKPHWRRVILLVGCIFTSIGMNLLMPQIIRYFIDMAQEGGAVENLMKAAGLYLAIGFGRQ